MRKIKVNNVAGHVKEKTKVPSTPNNIKNSTKTQLAKILIYIATTRLSDIKQYNLSENNLKGPSKKRSRVHYTSNERET